MKITSLKLFLAVSIFAFVLPFLTFANGGDQRVADGKYLINLSRAPFTPRVGVQTAMLPSFFDIEKNKLVAEDLLVKVRIYRFGGSGEEKRVLLFEKDNILVRGGVLEELFYTFAEPGLHEIFFDFAFASNTNKIYEAPDFLIDVQKPETPEENNVLILVGTATVFISGIIGWLIGRRTRIK